MHFIPLFHVLSNPYQGQPTFQACAFRFAFFFLLNILELSPPNQPRFYPYFYTRFSLTASVKILDHFLRVFFFLFSLKVPRINGDVA
jgi:hypothetical protein